MVCLCGAARPLSSRDPRGQARPWRSTSWTSTRSWRRSGRAPTARCTRRRTRPRASSWRSRRPASRDGRGGHPAHRALRDLPPQPPLPLHLRRPPPRRRAGRQERQAHPLPRLRVPRHRPQEVPRRLPQGTQPQAATAAPSQGNQLTILTHRNSDHFSFFFPSSTVIEKKCSIQLHQLQK